MKQILDKIEITLFKLRNKNVSSIRLDRGFLKRNIFQIKTIRTPKKKNEGMLSALALPYFGNNNNNDFLDIKEAEGLSIPAFEKLLNAIAKLKG